MSHTFADTELLVLGNSQVLELLRGTKEVGAELADIQDAVAGARTGSGWVLFTQRRHLPQLLFSIFLPVVQQYTGINSYMFYAVPTPAPAHTCIMIWHVLRQFCGCLGTLGVQSSADPFHARRV